MKNLNIKLKYIKFFFFLLYQKFNIKLIDRLLDYIFILIANIKSLHSYGGLCVHNSICWWFTPWMTTPRYQGDNILRDMAAAKKKDSYRREGKGRRCGLADRIASNLCRAGYFAQGRFEEKDE